MRQEPTESNENEDDSNIIKRHRVNTKDESTTEECGGDVKVKDGSMKDDQSDKLKNSDEE